MRHKLLPVIFITFFALACECRADLKNALSNFDAGKTSEALAELTPLANNGDPSAQYTLGIASYNGTGTEVDYAKALKWFTLAAKNDLAQAQYCLAVMYAHGQGTTKNPELALTWYRRAALGGYAEAFHNIGVMQAQGRGTPPDLVRALAHLMVAVDLNIAAAIPKRDFLLANLSPQEVLSARRQASQLKVNMKPAVAQLLPTLSAPKPIPAGR